MDITAQIESILYYKNEPVSERKLARLCDADKEKIKKATSELKKKLDDRGLSLIRKDGGLLLTTAPEASNLIENIKEEELNKDLTKAALETLTIVLYRGPLPKSDIDYIRGVNAGTILRKLRVRGLIEKSKDADNKRRILYTPTHKALQHLGISSVDELPEYDSIEEQIKEFKQKDKEEREQDPFQ
ncbi:MAG: SMC-Scp complex subunit ScpB [Parcubacteria group bacterium SW_4_46_8]|nr:MAG: SMC-Scp complex subunit ScpB [Parcubacteria group bacterium SW_4_46_8]